jgi:hypothetical protein
MIGKLIAALQDPYTRGYNAGYYAGFEDARAAIECDFPYLLRESLKSLGREMDKNEWMKPTANTSIAREDMTIDFRINVRRGFGRLVTERCLTAKWNPAPSAEREK